MSFSDSDRAKALQTRMANKALRLAGELPPIARKVPKARTKPNGESKAEHISEVRREAVLSRWESVQQERDNWLTPFRELSIERAMRYLEDLRVITTQAGHILNARINENKSIRCAGPGCTNDLTGVRPNGMPKWIAKKDFKDAQHPEIWHSLYFCTELCQNQWVKKQGGGSGGDGK